MRLVIRIALCYNEKVVFGKGGLSVGKEKRKIHRTHKTSEYSRIQSRSIFQS